MNLRFKIELASIIVLSGLAFAGLGDSQSALFSGRAQAQVSQSCGVQGGKCCTNSEGKQVPPGSKNGPYTCLPDGSWG